MAEDTTIRGSAKIFGTGNRARCAWEVRAGIVPGTPMPEHTRRFVLTSDGFYADAELTEEQMKEKYPDGKNLFLQAQSEAMEYARTLQHPNFVNWVELNWIWY